MVTAWMLVMTDCRGGCLDLAVTGWYGDCLGSCWELAGNLLSLPNPYPLPLGYAWMSWASVAAVWVVEEWVTQASSGSGLSWGWLGGRERL
jgi:hypothetical protein